MQIYASSRDVPLSKFKLYKRFIRDGQQQLMRQYDYHVAAAQMDDHFEIQIGGKTFRGNSGDYIARNADHIEHEWVIGQYIFESQYFELGPASHYPTVDEVFILEELESYRHKLIDIRAKTGTPRVPIFIDEYIYLPLHTDLPSQKKYFVLGKGIVGVVYEEPSNNPSPKRMVFSLAARWEIKGALDRIKKWFKEQDLE